MKARYCPADRQDPHGKSLFREPLVEAICRNSCASKPWPTLQHEESLDVLIRYKGNLVRHLIAEMLPLPAGEGRFNACGADSQLTFTPIAQGNWS